MHRHAALFSFSKPVPERAMSDSFQFTTNERRTERLRALHGKNVQVEEIGRSEEGRPIHGARAGRGEVSVSLIAGNHADEPVGPETLLRLLEALDSGEERWSEWLERCTFHVVPHTNPDGHARNRAWRERWPDPRAYLRDAVRELPGRDMEFGFPALRRENGCVSAFLRGGAPYALHASLHGMAMALGGLLLIEKTWGHRSEHLQQRFYGALREHGIGVHDQNRQGEKGFFYIGPGLTTTPEGAAMRAYFESRDDHEMAGRFLDSSMEYVRSLGGDALCVVTELPLFLLHARTREPLQEYEALREQRTEWKAALERDPDAEIDLGAFDLRPLPVEEAIAIQMDVIEAALEERLDS